MRKTEMNQDKHSESISSFRLKSCEEMNLFDRVERHQIIINCRNVNENENQSLSKDIYYMRQYDIVLETVIQG